MSTTTPNFTDQCTAYNNQLERHLPMPLAAWKALKSVLYAVLIGGVTWLSITRSGDPTIVGTTALIAIMLVFGIEIKEIQVADWLSITLKNGHDRDRDDRGTLLLSGGASIGLVAWAKDLTYKEVHAMTFGVMHGVGLVAAYVVGLPSVSMGLAATAFVLLGWLRTDQTRDVPLVSTILGAIPKSIKGQIRDEQHYYGGLLVVSALVSAVGYLFLPM